jgi:hypothetical protein
MRLSKSIMVLIAMPVAAGRVTDLRCGIVDKSGRTHAEHGMVGEIVIE